MTVLAVSPHLDDAAFSAGGTLARMSRAGHRVVIATVFTQSVADPTGFALTCQTDKGIAPETDYMALRRAEDTQACAHLGAEPVWLGLPEAPHRGYTSAPALFGDLVAPDQGTWRLVLDHLAELCDRIAPDLLLSCQGLGAHVDHRVVIRAVAALSRERGVPAAWWADLPYAIRQPGAQRAAELPHGLSTEQSTFSGDALSAKLDACAGYASQLPYQFARDLAPGDLITPEEVMRKTLARHALGGPENPLLYTETFLTRGGGGFIG